MWLKILESFWKNEWVQKFLWKKQESDKKNIGLSLSIKWSVRLGEFSEPSYFILLEESTVSLYNII